MNLKLLLGLALVLIGALSGGSAPVQAAATKPDGHLWGETVAGFQMATSLDESNGIVHCWIRNATTNEMDYPRFDFGYFENISLEIRIGTNWLGLQAYVFPRDNIATGGWPYLTKQCKPGQIITDTYARERYKPWPILNSADYLEMSRGNTNVALLTEQFNKRWAIRENFLAIKTSNDTYAIDLFGTCGLYAYADKNSQEVRVVQNFRMNREKIVTLYSPVFTLDAAVIQTYVKQNRELFGK